MPAAVATPTPKSDQSPKRRLRYRGVLLQSPAVPSRTPLAKIQKAVEAAVAKNAESLACSK